MYLSRVKIDQFNRHNLRELKHLGCYHGWIESSFPTEKAEAEKTRKLWRIDTLNNEYYLILLSETAPDMALLEKYGVKGSGSSKNYDKFLDSLKQGMRAKFRIKLNAVKSYSDRETYKKRGQVKPVPLAELKSFFLERTQKNGFEVQKDEFDVSQRINEFFQHSNPKDKEKPDRINLASVTYEGILTITDLEKFKQTLQKGIGKKKAYGFGLLTIIPVK